MAGDIKIPKIHEKFRLLSKVTKGYLYECSCGRKRRFTRRQITNLKFICKCDNGDNTELTKQEDQLLKRYIRGAKNRGYKFKLSNKNFKYLIHRRCTVCGVEPSRDIDGMKYNGIDRSDSSGDYTLNNTDTLCFECNRAKNNMNIVEFNKWIGRIVSNQSEKKEIMKTNDLKRMVCFDEIDRDSYINTEDDIFWDEFKHRRG